MEVYISEHILVVDERHGEFTNSWGMKKCVNSIHSVYDTQEVAEVALKQLNSTVHIKIPAPDKCEYQTLVYPPEHQYRIKRSIRRTG